MLFYVTMSKGGKFCIGKADENGNFKKDNKYNFPYKDDIIYIIQFSVLGLKNQSIDFLNIDDESNYKVNGSVINSKAEGIKYKRLNDEDGVKNILNMSDNSNLSISGKAAFLKLNDFIVYKIKQLEGDTYEVIDEYNFSNSEKFLKLSSYKINYIVCSQDKESRINNCSVPHIVLPSNRITLKDIDELYMENTSGNLLYSNKSKKEIFPLRFQKFDMKNAGKESELIIRELNFNNEYENNGYIFAESENMLVNGKSANSLLFRSLFTIKNVIILLLIYFTFLLFSLVVIGIYRKLKNRFNVKKEKRKEEKKKHGKCKVTKKVKKIIIGVVIPVASVVIYFFANWYSKESNKIQYMLNLPSFNINVSKDDKDNILCHVGNEGGSIKEATLTPHMYLSMNNYKIDSKYTVEIKDFFGEKILTEDLYLYSAQQNFKTKTNGWDIFIDSKKEKGAYSSLFNIGEKIVSQNLLVRLDLCFEIKYVDFMGENHEEWYWVDYNESSIHCLNESYSTPLEVYKTDRSINLDDLESNDIIRELAKEFESNLLVVKEK